MPSMSQTEAIAGLAYEATARGEFLAAFADRFHAWSPDDDRWSDLGTTLSTLDRMSDPDVSRHAVAIARHAVTLMVAAHDLLLDGGAASIEVAQTILATTRETDATLMDFLQEAARAAEKATR